MPMPYDISSVGASSTLITVTGSLSENGALYPLSTDFSGGISGPDWVPSEEVPSRSRLNGKVERKALPLFLHFFLIFVALFLLLTWFLFVEVCFSVCSSFFVCCSISEVVSFLRFARNWLLQIFLGFYFVCSFSPIL